MTAEKSAMFKQISKFISAQDLNLNISVLSSNASQAANSCLVSTILQYCILQKKDKDRRKRQRLSLLVGQNLFNSLLRQLFALERFEDKDEFILFFPNHPGAIHPILQIVLLQNSQRGKKFNNLCPPNNSDDLCLLFYINPSSMSPYDCQCPLSVSKYCNLVGKCTLLV